VEFLNYEKNVKKNIGGDYGFLMPLSTIFELYQWWSVLSAEETMSTR
jgi:hypothetical protein